MTDLLWLIGAFAIGGALGAAYFAGLWATTQRLPVATNPGLIVFASFTLRLVLAVTAFVVLARVGGWRWIAAGLVGFMLARTAIVRRLRPSRTTLGHESR
jgi:F1F0 ATPase subunit 2